MNVFDLEKHIAIVKSADGLLEVTFLEGLFYVLPGAAALISFIWIACLIDDIGPDFENPSLVYTLFTVLILGVTGASFFLNKAFHGDMTEQWSSRSEYDSILSITSLINKTGEPLS